MLTACRANCHRTELIVVLVVVVLAQNVKDEHENGLVRGFSGVRRKQRKGEGGGLRANYTEPAAERHRKRC